MATLACQSCGHPISGMSGERCPICLSLPGPVGANPSVMPALSVDAERSVNAPRCDVGIVRRGAPIGPAEVNVIEGTVLQTYGPSQAEGRRDWWRLGATLLLIGALLPVFVGLWAVLFTWRLVLGMVGLRIGGGRGLFGEIVAFHLVGNALRTPDPVPVYDHIVDTGAGLVQVRQEGEFQDGRIFVGNQVRLHGRRRGGALVILEGFNHTLGTSLSFRASPWRPAFVLLFLLLAGGFAVLVALAPNGAMPR